MEEDEKESDKIKINVGGERGARDGRKQSTSARFSFIWVSTLALTNVDMNDSNELLFHIHSPYLQTQHSSGNNDGL